MIPQSFIQELLNRVDIVDVVDRHVPLKKAGANYSACCPFHSEKSPSFTVSPTKQFYHCFGCGAHGTAIGFLMEYSGLSYPDAIRELAQQIGLNVPQDETRSRTPRPDNTPLTELMARAAKYYRDQLMASSKAIDYLKRRGLTGEIAARFGLGYAPDGWQNLESAFPDYRARELAEIGLVIENEQGRRYDRFRDRIMFPILDARGNVIGFGGRILDQGEPKYLNSPETPLFEKGRELYGLTQARNAIRDSGTVIVVEGYMDVVGLAQHGVENVVAALGTATTPTHVQKLLKQADRLVYCFDKDAAGFKAAWRALEVCLEHVADGKHIGFAFMPGDQDPDEYVREFGADSFNRFVRQPKSLSEFLTTELAKRNNPTTGEGKAALLGEARPMVERIGSPVLRLAIIKELTRMTGFAQREVESACGLKQSASWVRPGVAPAAPASRRAPASIARALLKLVARHPEWAARLPVDLIEYAGPEAPALAALTDAVSLGELGHGGIAATLEYFRETPHAAVLGEVVAELVDEPIEDEAMESMFNDTLETLRRAGVRKAIEALIAKEREVGLSTEERHRYVQLIAQKQKLGAGQAPPAQDRIAGFSDSPTA